MRSCMRLHETGQPFSLQPYPIAHDKDEYASPCGLGGTIYTLDPDEMFRSVNEIESGILWVNAPLLDNDALSFGGRKLSGTAASLARRDFRSFRD